jgi:hypothetical protein
MSTFVKSVLVVVLFALVSSVLVGCGGNNVVENARLLAQQNFEKDPGQKLTRPEAAALWSAEVGKLQVCENVARQGDVVYIQAAPDKSSFQFVLFSQDKPGCGMSRPWSPVLNSLLASGAYSAKAPAIAKQ